MRRFHASAFVLVSFLTAAGPLAADDEAGVRTFAVRTLPDAAAIAESVRSGSFERWRASRNASAKLVVGPDARGDVEVEARVLPADEALARRLERLPVGIRGAGIVFDGTHYPSPRYALALRLPEPEKPSWVVVGHDARTVASVVDLVLFSTADVRFRRRAGGDFDYLVWEHHWAHRAGKWLATEDGYAVDPEERDAIAARAAVYEALVGIERPGVILRVPRDRANDPAFRELADQLGSAVSSMAPRIPVELERPLEVLVEQDFHVMGKHLAAIGEVVFDPEGRLHVVYHPDDLSAYRHGVARALLRRAGLELPPALEDGAALWLSRDWFGRAYGGWLPGFAAGQVWPAVDEIFADGPRSHRSEVLAPPVTAALVDRLPGETARDKLAPVPAAAKVAAVLRTMENEAASVASRSAPRATRAARRGFHHGVSLAMANGLEVGYHAPGVDDQLARLDRLGADSVSLMPFAWQPSPTEPRMSFMNGSPGSETDVGMVHAARRAHDRGFRVLWKPHIWVSHGSWPGEIEMTTEEDWQTWWRAYRRYVLRHAVLAEWTGTDLYSVGVELGKTLSREKEWRSLIRAVRQVYSGELTYAGNWWGDFDRAPFWDQLDYVGVDAYFPLAHRADADRDALVAGARKAREELRAAAERFGKPVLLTEVGFAARKGAWVSPHEEGGDFDEEHQTVAYEVLLATLGRPDWLRGVYFWKVFSHPAVTAGARPDFQFLGRGAEEVVRSYFGSNPDPVPAAE